MKFILPFLLLAGFAQHLFAQSAYAPLNRDYYHLLDRYEIKLGHFAPGFQTVSKPYTRQAIGAFADSIFQAGLGISKADQFNIAYLRADNWEWSNTAEADSKKPIFGALYKKQSDFYHVQEDDLDLHINPVLHIAAGRDPDLASSPFVSTRGVQIRGNINKKLGFYTFLTDNLVRFPSYVQERTSERNAVPNEGFWKNQNDGRAEFFTARGYITFQALKHINFQFGNDRNFVGNGHRSLILSDFSNNYLFLKAETNIWKLKYTNLFTQMTARNVKVNNIYPKKFMTFHHLGINITKNLNVGVFESVTFSRGDSLGNNAYDISYLNPLIFYRAIEHHNGDPDNAILGLDFKWNFLKQFQLYGQFVFDELLFDEFIGGNGWWGNKQGVQLGGKYIDMFGIPNLDLQMEANIVRPYTYTHFINPEFSNYTHYEQPLAHQMGANFREVLGILRYQPIPRLSLTFTGILLDTGTDGPGENWGQNIFLDYDTRPFDFGHEIGQGTGARMTFIDLTATYMLRHNLFLEAKQVVRDWDSDDDALDRSTTFTNFVLRWNIPQRLHDF